MFECPYCHEKTFTRMMKVRCGSMKSKGMKCPKCGGHCVNGMPSTIFRTVTSALVFIYWIAASLTGFETKNFRVFTFIGAMLLCFLLGYVFDALFGRLAKSVRLDIED